MQLRSDQNLRNSARSLNEAKAAGKRTDPSEVKMLTDQQLIRELKHSQQVVVELGLTAQSRPKVSESYPCDSQLLADWKHFRVDNERLGDAVARLPDHDGSLQSSVRSYIENPAFHIISFLVAAGDVAFDLGNGMGFIIRRIEFYLQSKQKVVPSKREWDWGQSLIALSEKGTHCGELMIGCSSLQVMAKNADFVDLDASGQVLRQIPASEIGHLV